MSHETNKKTASEFFAHFKRKEVDQALAKLTDDAIWTVPGKPDLFPLAGPKTKAEMKVLLTMLVTDSKDGLELRISGMTAEDDRVAVEAESFGVLANGREYNNQYHFLLQFRGGRICAVREYLDTMHTADVLNG